jgi:hypothetical protein
MHSKDLIRFIQVMNRIVGGPQNEYMIPDLNDFI